jgi:hypothetical protein
VKAKKLLWPHFKFLSFMLGVLVMAEIEFSAFDLLLLAPKVGGRTQKNCSNFVHGDLGMVQNSFFALNLLFLMPKVKG